MASAPGGGGGGGAAANPAAAAPAAAPQHEVDRILSAENFFDRLGLQRKMTASVEVRKRYRRVALRCHPDKVSHPQAKAAFQKLSEAFDVLHDEVQQSMYMDKLKTRDAEAAAKARKAARKKRASQWNQKGTKPFVYGGSAGAAAGVAGGGGKARKRKKPHGKSAAGGPKKWYESNRSWQEVEAELRRREEAEAKLRARFRGQQSIAFTERALLNFHRRMQQICQTLDERRGIPRHALWPPERPPPQREELDPLRPPGRAAAMAAAAAAAAKLPKPPTAKEALVAMEALLGHLHDTHDYTDLDDEYFEFAWKPSGGSGAAAGGAGAGGPPKKKVYDY